MARKLGMVLALIVALTFGSVAVVTQRTAGAATGDSVVLAWNRQLLDTIKETRTGPTIAARALAVVHTAIYDAWAAYDPAAVDTRQRLRASTDLRQPAAERTLDNKTKAVSFAAYAALIDLFPARQARYAQQMNDLGYAVDGSDTSTAAMIGATAAQAVLDFRHHDGANQLGDRNGGRPLLRLHRLPAGQHLGPGQGPRPLAAPVPPRCPHPVPPSAPAGSRRI